MAIKSCISFAMHSAVKPKLCPQTDRRTQNSQKFAWIHVSQKVFVGGGSGGGMRARTLVGGCWNLKRL